MFRRSRPLVLATLLVWSGAYSLPAAAHAVITATTLQDTPIKANSHTEVALFFNSNIEFKLSKVQLVSKGDVHQTLKIKRGKQRGELIVELPELAEGKYVLKYKVFAADGHLTDDLLRFSVAP